MEGEGDEEDVDKGETEWVNEDEAAKMGGTEEVFKATDLVTLDKLLEQAGVSSAEHKKFKEQDALWFTYDLLDLSAVEIITEPQYCSKTTRHALYMIAEQLCSRNTSEWEDDCDITSFKRRGKHVVN